MRQDLASALVVSSWAGPLSGGVRLGVGLGGATVDSVIGLERALLELEVGARVDELLARRANFGLLVGGKGELLNGNQIERPRSVRVKRSFRILGC